MLCEIWCHFQLQAYQIARLIARSMSLTSPTSRVIVKYRPSLLLKDKPHHCPNRYQIVSIFIPGVIYFSLYNRTTHSMKTSCTTPSQLSTGSLHDHFTPLCVHLATCAGESARVVFREALQDLSSMCNHIQQTFETAVKECKNKDGMDVD